jgi:hypothetical protein
MPYTTYELITDAYYLSGIVSRGLQTLTPLQSTDGLNRLNGFLQIKGSESKQIQYYTVYNSQFVAGQEIYFIPNLIEIDTFAFFLQDPVSPPTNSVRFELQNLSRYEYFAVPRPEHVETIPYSWHLERTLGGSNVYVYFIPNTNYNYQITGKFALQNVAINQDLSTVYDGWYLEYMRYGLALYLCEWNGIAAPASVAKTFAEMEASLTTLSPVDFTLRKLSYFRSIGGLNWGDVNYGKGWRGGSY